MQGISTVYKMHKEFGHIWILPILPDCMDFTMSEFGEVFDACMQLNTIYFRNNARDTDINAEIADVIMMLVKYYIHTYAEEDFIDFMLKNDDTQWKLFARGATLREVLYLSTAGLSTFVIGGGILVDLLPGSSTKVLLYAQPVDIIWLLIDYLGVDNFASYMQKKYDKMQKKVALQNVSN